MNERFVAKAEDVKVTPVEDLLSPKYPEGTPEYDAYAKALRAELEKLRTGEILINLDAPFKG